MFNYLLNYYNHNTKLNYLVGFILLISLCTNTVVYAGGNDKNFHHHSGHKNDKDHHEKQDYCKPGDEKVAICHHERRHGYDKYFIINISPNAVEKHMSKHGDTLVGEEICANGVDENCDGVIDEEPCRSAQLTLGKSTTALDVPDLSEVPPGTPISWSYIIDNPGTETLQFTLSDEATLDSVAIPAIESFTCALPDVSYSILLGSADLLAIEPGQSITCEAEGEAQLGNYENTAKISYFDELLDDQREVAATSSYVGAEPSYDCPCVYVPHGNIIRQYNQSIYKICETRGPRADIGVYWNENNSNQMYCIGVDLVKISIESKQVANFCVDALNEAGCTQLSQFP